MATTLPLDWTHCPATKDKPGYDEASIIDLVGLTSDDPGQIIDVTIRKYPKRYFLAVEWDIEDHSDYYFDVNYTQDGDGDGIIYDPAFVFTTVTHKLLHHEFDTAPWHYIHELAAYLRKRFPNESWGEFSDPDQWGI